MRITVFGAAGGVGSRVVAEALSRGHNVTAVARSPRPGYVRGSVGGPAADLGAGLGAGLEGGLEGGLAGGLVVGNATHVEDVARLSAGQDLVISATRPPDGSEQDLVTTAKALLAGTRTRLLLVGGAGGLTVPGTGGRTVLDDPRYMLPAYRKIALACDDQLAACRAAAEGVDWTYLSPPATLAPGERTGRYRLGADELLVDDGGRSHISTEDLAVALIDEAERPRHHRTRFTVAY
ncbi:NAD(P)-dependent oxidoreductase [Nonomuraea rhizosphaerae]|uniref:NAD(P)-dependent oxidoreductase n=1 Tax=Nonomuraea rhizosphaerae TaxID=2665663 RepID=UPI001C606DA0|nr:NAD(P)H-binding protein [Nonomuraea rhizosphaerae]